jgi:predicted choloylglycine hydrolase
VSGRPFDLGVAIGAAAPDLVSMAIEEVCRFEYSRSQLVRRMTEIESTLGAVFPETLEEAEGVAVGARVSRLDVLALSLASDLHGRLPGWCSVLAVPGKDGILVGKNLDTRLELSPLQVVERVERHAGIGFTHVTTAGAMWTDGGVNDAGLALVNTSLAAARIDPKGVPDGILAREILATCGSVAAAVALAQGVGVRTLGESMLVADARGQQAVIETLPGGKTVRTAPAAMAACNHVLDPGLARLAGDNDPIRANSLRRFAELTAAMARTSHWTTDTLGSVLMGPGIHQGGQDGLWTVASIIVSPRERRLWIRDRTSRTKTFDEVTVDMSSCS